MKRLIVTADDLGLDTARDRGVMDAFDRGLVTSASLIASGPTARQGATDAKKRAGLSLGLHLCLVQGRPVATPDDVPTLVNARGHLPASVLHLAMLRPRWQDLEREVLAQYLRFLDLVGTKPAFVNTHQHAQLLPPVLDVMLQLCRVHDIPRVRYPAEQQPLRPNLRLRSWLWPAATAIARFERPRLDAAGLRHPDRMVGGPESGRLTARHLQRLLKRLSPGTTELVVHPSEGTAELAALTDPEVVAALDRAGVERIPFHAL